MHEFTETCMLLLLIWLGKVLIAIWLWIALGIRELPDYALTRVSPFSLFRQSQKHSLAWTDELLLVLVGS